MKRGRRALRRGRAERNEEGAAAPQPARLPDRWQRRQRRRSSDGEQAEEVGGSPGRDGRAPWAGVWALTTTLRAASMRTRTAPEVRAAEGLGCGLAEAGKRGEQKQLLLTMRREAGRGPRRPPPLLSLSAVSVLGRLGRLSCLPPPEESAPLPGSDPPPPPPSNFPQLKGLAGTLQEGAGPPGTRGRARAKAPDLKEKVRLREGEVAPCLPSHPLQGWGREWLFVCSRWPASPLALASLSLRKKRTLVTIVNPFSSQEL